jgi:ribosomal protein L1
MSRSGLAETSDMLPHSEGKPVRLAVAATHRPVLVAVLVGEVGEVGDVDVEGLESHTLIPHDVAVGPPASVPLVAELGWAFCPQPMVTSPPSAMTAATWAEQTPNRMYASVS